MQKRRSSWKKEDTKSLVGKIYFSERRITIESGEESYYVHPPRARGFIHGDLVAFSKSRPAKDGKMAEAKPERLVKRSEEEVIVEVTLSKKGAKWSLLSVFGNLIIEVTGNPRVEEGDLYIAKFVSGRRVELIRKFGNMNDVNILEELILFQAGVRTKWPSDVESYVPERPRIESHGTHVPVISTEARYERNGEILPNKEEDFYPQGVYGLSASLTLRSKGHKAFGLTPLSQSLSLKDSLFANIRVNDKERVDFRSWYTMTIDGADAKDLDDAISIAKYEGGDTLLGVHIADVAEYVREHTPLDREAYLRGTSIYTPGRVIPMLPEVLSNDLCSLHPGEPKLVLSILMRIDKQGHVKESFVTEGLIESRHRGVYEDVLSQIQESLGTQRGSGENTVGVRGEQENDGQSERVYSSPRPLVTFGHESNIDRTEKSKADSSNHLGCQAPVPTEVLNNFSSLYHTLSERRKKEGKIIFETTECYFDLDDDRKVQNIRKRERGDAHMMIEEFMVLANEEVAKWCVKRKIPFLSRVHDAPSAEKTREIHDVILANVSPSGILNFIPGADIEPHHIRSVLEHAKSDSELYLFSRLLLPKMAKAVYREKPVRHFGLALTHYAHFTSPIRRYPDLLLHRMVKKYLHRELKKSGNSQKREVRESKNFSKGVYGQVNDREKFEADKEIRSFSEFPMKKWGESLSQKERNAEDVSRSIDDLFMCRYMEDKVGEVFKGIISGVTESNVYVELDNGVEGSIYLGGMKGSPKLTLDLARGSLRDAIGKEVYRIGEKISVKIESVDVKARRIEMILD